MLSLVEIEEILTKVEFRDWKIIVKDENQADGVNWISRYYLQVIFYAPDMVTGEPERQSSRKWFLSQHMTKSEIVTTALKACLTAVEHEAREDFKYKGKAIFGPHWDVDSLYEMCKVKNLDMRTGHWVK